MQDSWIHGTDLDPNSEWHASAVRVEQYTTLIHNTLACDCTGPINNDEIGCSADMTGYPDFAPINHNTIDGNLFMANPIGLGFCAYGGNDRRPSRTPTTRRTPPTSCSPTTCSRRGSNGKCGAYGPVTDFDTAGTGNTWFNNLWDDGTPVAPG